MIIVSYEERVKMFALFIFMMGVMIIITPNVFATSSDPISVVNNLSSFLLTKVIGGIIVGYSIVQIGLSFTSHDASQRASGFMFFAGGLIIMFAETILNLIAG